MRAETMGTKDTAALEVVSGIAAGALRHLIPMRTFLPSRFFDGICDGFATDALSKETNNAGSVF